ncbi:Transposable element tcb1 transposase, partial [Caligus rogercresseyi]
IENQSTFSHGKGEKACDVRLLPCREEFKGGDRVLQLPQVDRLRPVEGLELFQKELCSSQKRSRSLGATRTDEFVTEVKRKINEDKGLKVNTAIYIDVMKNVVKPRMNLVANGRPYGDPGVAVGEPPLPLEPGLAAPQLPDCNPLDYFFWGMVENKTNKHAHNTLDSLRAAIVEEFANMKKDVVAKACGRFRHRLEMVVAADGAILKNIYLYMCAFHLTKNC